MVDPGFGFGKTATHNLVLLARLDELTERFDVPVLVGTSRKTFIGAAIGEPVGAREEATLATVVWAFERGASMVRVHDARAASRAVRLLDSLARAA